MRSLGKSLLLTVAAMSPVTTLSQNIQPVQGATSPQAAYEYMTQYQYPDTVSTASVEVDTVYKLEDQTYLGSDHTSLSQPACNCANPQLYSGVQQAVGVGVASNVGATAGWMLGSVAAEAAVSLIPVGAGTAATAVGLGVLAAGPWIGLAVVTGVVTW
jgi:hypothetical protein